MNYRKKFISLDLETTHLDMTEGRIMEVGAVAAEIFFNGESNRIEAKFGDSFSTLVNPEIEASAGALALTGITAEELKAVPLWKAVKKDLSDFLGDSSLLGHNLAFDLDFLKNQGLKLKNSFYDSLEVALTLLPLSPSHSLEFLVDHLGVAAEISHRALADSESAVRVLTATFNEFLKLSLPLQKTIKEIFSRSDLSFRDLVCDMPEIEIKDRRTSKPDRPYPVQAAKSEVNFWQKNKIFSLPISFGGQQGQLVSFASQKKSGLIAVSHPLYLDDLPNEQVIAHPDNALCEKRLNDWFSRELSSALGCKILAKILIFREILGGLDLSAIKWTSLERQSLGSFVTSPEICRAHQCGYAKVIASPLLRPQFLELATLFSLVFDWQTDFKKQPVLLFDLSTIEQAFTESLSVVTNLRQIRERLAQIYPIDKNILSSKEKAPKEVEAVANELDLFFGILHLVFLKKTETFAENLIVNEQVRTDTRFSKLFHPAEKLVSKLTAFANFLAQRGEEELTILNNEISQTANFLREFFLEPEDGKVYWCKFDSFSVDLNCSPRLLAGEWQDFSKLVGDVSIIDTEMPQVAFAYFVNRLGIESYEQIAVPAKRKEMSVEIAPQINITDLDGSVLAIVPNERELQKLYESLHNETSVKEVIAYKFSGNVPKVRLQLAAAAKAKKPFILLLSTHAYLRYFLEPPPAQNLIIYRLPFEAPGMRPHLVAPDGQVDFRETVLPRAIHTLHQMISRFAAFAAVENPKIFIADRRALGDYDQVFLRYFQEFPDFRISTALEH